MTARARTRRARALSRAAALLALSAVALTGCTSHPAKKQASADAPAAASSIALRDAAAPYGLKVGVAVNTDRLSDPAYADLTAQQFSTVTPENVMKWEVTEPKQGVYDWSAADELVAFAAQHDQQVRGHNLVWHSQLPQWLTDAAPTMTADQLRAVLKEHVTAEVTHFAGKVWQWDVVNEPIGDNGQLRDDFWLDKLGPDYIADAFRWAHAADPAAKLFLNEYGIEDAGAKSRAMFQLVSDLKAEGVPIDGVGFETHLDATYAEPDLESEMRRYTALGLDVAVTEADVRAQLPADKATTSTQSKYFADTVKACADVPQCISYTVWGLDDKDSWIPGVYPGEGAATLFDDELKPKPEFAAVQKALTAPKAPQRSE